MFPETTTSSHAHNDNYYHYNTTNNNRSGLLELLHRRSEGRLVQNEFRKFLTHRRRWKQLSRRRQIQSLQPHTTHAGACLEALHLHPADERYLLTGSRNGTFSVYDISSFGATLDYRRETRNDTNYDRNNPRQRQQRRDRRFGRPEQELTAVAVHAPIAQSTASNPLLPATTRMRILDDNDNDAYNVAANAPQHGHGRGPLLSARWYPVDSGAFVAAFTTGTLQLWDTNEMTPLLEIAPFAAADAADASSTNRRRRSGTTTYTKTSLLSHMDLSAAFPNLVAVTSWHSPTVQLVDLRTGASSHTLTGHTGMGVAVVHWSPTAAGTNRSHNPHVLASGGASDGAVRLWDIRKAGRHGWLLPDPGCLDSQAAYAAHHLEPSLTNDEFQACTATELLPEYGHLRVDMSERARQQTTPTSSSRKSKKRRVGLSSLAATVAPNDYSTRRGGVARSHPGACVKGLAFAGAGRYLISHSPADPPGESVLRLWDLYQSPALLVPLRFNRHTAGSSSSSSTNHNNNSNNTRLAVLHEGSPDGTVWIHQGNLLLSYNLEQGGPPEQVLTGHLNDIRDMQAVETSQELWTADADGLVLVWEPSTVANNSNDFRPQDDESERQGGQNVALSHKRVRIDQDSW